MRLTTVPGGTVMMQSAPERPRHLLLAAVLRRSWRTGAASSGTDQVVDVGIDHDDDAAAATAVAAVGTAIGHVFFAQETAGAGPAVAGPRDDANAIDKHRTGMARLRANATGG